MFDIVKIRIIVFYLRFDGMVEWLNWIIKDMLFKYINVK